jgi:hypothetical protein
MTMKKILVFLVLSGLIIGNIFAGDGFDPNKRLKSGVWLKFGYDATTSKFLYNEDATRFDEKMSNFGLNFQLGTTFYLGPRIGNMLRFGLDAGWLDFSYFTLNSDFFDNGNDYFLNFFQVGPIISFSPVKAIAFDAYVRVVPSLSFLHYENNNLGSTTSYDYLGYHTNGLFGVTFRAGVFSTGFEYNFGKMKYAYLGEDTSVEDTDLLFVNNLRLLIGFKF